MASPADLVILSRVVVFAVKVSADRFCSNPLQYLCGATTPPAESRRLRPAAAGTRVPAAAGRSRRDSAGGVVAPHKYCSGLLQNRSADTFTANTTTRDKITRSAGDAITTASQGSFLGAQS